MRFLKMTPKIEEPSTVLNRIRVQAQRNEFRITTHANQEMLDENISLEEIIDVLKNAVLLENYPEHRRGACCLIGALTSRSRHIHVVCTTAREVAIIITAYEPMPPKWVKPFERGTQS